MGASGELVFPAASLSEGAAASEAFDMCDFAFEYGEKNANNCTDDKHHLIYIESLCIRAAEEGNLSTDKATFDLPGYWFDKYPKGCFRAPCGNNPKGCLFFNADGDNPTHPGGYPICSRPRYLNGTTNSTGEASHCPHGYEIIKSKSECEAAADCLGFCEGDNFDVSLAVEWNRMNYPQGCFIGNTVLTGPCVHWNPVVPSKVPTHPAGIPICRAPNELALPSS